MSKDVVQWVVCIRVEKHGEFVTLMVPILSWKNMLRRAKLRPDARDTHFIIRPTADTFEDQNMAVRFGYSVKFKMRPSEIDER
jgi:hypothetical protein